MLRHASQFNMAKAGGVAPGASIKAAGSDQFPSFVVPSSLDRGLAHVGQGLAQAQARIISIEGLS